MTKKQVKEPKQNKDLAFNLLEKLYSQRIEELLIKIDELNRTVKLLNDELFKVKIIKKEQEL